MPDRKRVLVTGSTRGIGRAAAEKLLAAGAEVIVHGRRAEVVARAVGELSQVSSVVSGVHGELSERTEIARIAAEAGDVDVLVNCAGVYREVPLERLDAAAFDAIMEANLTAPWLLTRALLDGLRRRRGLVINIGSDAAILGYAGCTAYCASKGGIVGLTRALAVELSPTVRAICICPGPVATDMMRESLARAVDAEAELQKWAVPTFLGRVAEPHEIGAMIAFAASDAASFATGAVWLVDGGVTAGRRI